MPSLNMKVEHSLSRDEATERLRIFLTRVRVHYEDRVANVQEEWGDNWLRFAFSAMGFSSSGQITIEESHVQVDGKIPLAAMMFRGQIESTIREQLSRALS